MKFTCDKCGWEIFADFATICPRCKDTGSWIERKPTWVRWLTILRQPTDRGVGDVAQRLAAKFGGERFKQFAERIGIPCGCAERQQEWNSRWPFA